MLIEAFGKMVWENLQNTLKPHYEMNHPFLANWTDKPDLDQLNEVAGRIFSYAFANDNLKRLTAGLFIKEIKTVFKNSLKEVKDQDIPIKFNLYSAHETTLASVLNALGVYDMEVPPYGATLMFEFYERKPKQKQMKVYYLKYTEYETPELLKLPACNYEETCDFKMFLKNMNHLIVKNWNSECLNSKLKGSKKGTPLALLQLDGTGNFCN
ncbi:testicular acid phosphatase-like protein [Dinothrombium tinctorium]|uniref:acid phosphatase n=1 Tax=Dinothrombium tinctorium TaxID=1965070 RepID=A0A3S3P0L5_9ACAR|nr:testicular acid phosphatase-like protein [Dinothrombium tinctorium]